MIRRKKLLKLKIKKQDNAPRKKSQHELLVESCVKNVKKRNKQEKQKIREEWKAEYKEKVLNAGTPYEPRETWLNGHTNKRSVFDPVNLKEYDIEEINSKRQAIGIHDPIEIAAEKAIDQAKEKSKRIGIAYSKGNYQYITEGTSPSDIGKKTNQLN